MGELKQHQPPMTIEEQVKNLKDIGLIVDDEEHAKQILNDISYFRLIKAYSLNLKPKNGKYNGEITFEQIVELYLFNANLRQLIFPEIEKVEINVASLSNPIIKTINSSGEYDLSKEKTNIELYADGNTNNGLITYQWQIGNEIMSSSTGNSFLS